MWGDVQKVTACHNKHRQRDLNAFVASLRPEIRELVRKSIRRDVTDLGLTTP